MPGEYRQLGGVRVPVLADRSGRFALALGALTSGHAVMLDADGSIRFQGGLTLARGHRGRAPAQDAILAALAGDGVPMPAAPVFGCALRDICGAVPSP